MNHEYSLKRCREKTNTHTFMLTSAYKGHVCVYITQKQQHLSYIADVVKYVHQVNKSSVDFKRLNADSCVQKQIDKYVMAYWVFIDLMFVTAQYYRQSMSNMAMKCRGHAVLLCLSNSASLLSLCTLTIIEREMERNIFI